MIKVCHVFTMTVVCSLMTTTSLSHGQSSVNYPCYFGVKGSVELPQESKTCFLFPIARDEYGVLIGDSKFQAQIISRDGKGGLFFEPVEISRRAPSVRHYDIGAMFDSKKVVAFIYRDLESLEYKANVTVGETTTTTVLHEFDHKSEVNLIGWVRGARATTAVLQVVERSGRSAYWLGCVRDSRFQLATMDFASSEVDAMFVSDSVLVVRQHSRKNGDVNRGPRLCIYRIVTAPGGVKCELLRSIEAALVVPPDRKAIDIKLDRKGKRLGVLGLKDGGKSFMRVIEMDGEYRTLYDAVLEGETEPWTICLSDDEECAVFVTRYERQENDGASTLRLFDEIHVVQYRNSHTQRIYVKQRVGKADIHEIQMVWPRKATRPIAGWRVFVPYD